MELWIKIAIKIIFYLIAIKDFAKTDNYTKRINKFIMNIFSASIKI